MSFNSVVKAYKFKDINKILIIKLRHIGDVLLTVPVFRALRETFPAAHISALVNSGTEEVLSGNPLIDEILILNRSMKKLLLMERYLREMNFLKEIRRKGFDMTIDLTGGDRAAIISLFSGAKHRIGWKKSKGFVGKKHLYTHLSKPDGRRHMVLQNLDVISLFGISTENLSVDFHISENDRVFIEKILQENNMKENTSVVHVHPTSRWLFKCWKDEHMAEIIKWLLDRDITVIVTSSPEMREIEKAKKILSLVFEYLSLRHMNSKLIDLCGKITIKQLGAVSEVSDLFFGVDSAPMHIAAATGTPVIALFGPSGVFNWGPWDNNQKSEVRSQKSEGKPYPKQSGVQAFGKHVVVQKDWECIPCGKDGCNSSKISKCLEDIKPDEIKAIIEDKLRGLPL